MPEMTWKIEFDNRARKELRKLDESSQQRILAWISSNLKHTDNPRQHGKSLKGHFRGLWRYRIGNFRIISQIRDQEISILIIRIAHRKDVYGK